SVSKIRHLDLLAGPVSRDIFLQFRHRVHTVLFDTNDNITRLNSGLLGGARLMYPLHEYTLTCTERQLFGNARIDILDLDTEQPALHLAEFEQVISHFTHKTYRDGERITLVHPVVGCNSGVDADEFALKVDQCTTAVARIHGGICLNKRFHLEIVAIPEDTDVPRLCADDAGGHR